MSPQGSLATGERVYLRRLRPRDCDAFVAAVRASRKLHRPWVTPADTEEAFEEKLRRSRGPSDDRLVICRIEDDALVGNFSLGQIFHGPFRSAYLGYYAFMPFAGHGYMREGLSLVCDHAFGMHGLHRLQANIQPGNAASLALVRDAGFTKEGLARRYLKIGGRWQDHETWALLAEDPRARPHRAARRGA